MNAWYDTQIKPPLTPPDWVFSPVWTVLYVMIAASIVIYVRKTWADKPLRVYGLIALHLVANGLWTPLFFGLKAPGWALVDIVVLDLSLGAMIFAFWKVSRLASVLLWPYLAWVLFATYLNAAFFVLNRSA